MKSKFFVIVAIIALVGFVATLDYGNVWAQQTDEEPPVPYDSTMKPPQPTEFSNNFDSQAEGVFWGLDGVNPLQVVYTEMPDAPGPFVPDNRSLDFGESGECDALANLHDALLSKLVCRDPVRFASLLVSFQSDPGAIAVYSHSPMIGACRTFPMRTHLNFINPLPGGSTLDDLDGLQLWGGAAGTFGNRYSMLGDPGGFSVYNSDNSGYVPQAVIQAAVVSLGYTGGTVDLDALMVRDHGVTKTWDEPDTIIFSIRGTTGSWDGGEIVVLPCGGAADYLWGIFHPFNTAHDWVASGAPNEEVDAIEAYPCRISKTPALTEWGLLVLVALLIISTVFVLLKRRKAVVRA